MLKLSSKLAGKKISTKPHAVERHTNKERQIHTHIYVKKNELVVIVAKFIYTFIQIYVCMNEHTYI